MTPLAGRRILLVEDEFLVAAMAEDMLTELGAIVVGPASNIAIALALVESERLDAALLDVNMNGESVEPVAAALCQRCIPVVLATGYGNRAGDRIPGAPVLDKPYTQQRLAEALTRALEGPA